MVQWIHPALVHFTVAFTFTGALVEAAGLLLTRQRVARWGAGLLLVGLLSFVPTLVSGYVAANSVTVSTVARSILDTHEIAAWLVFVALLGLQFWKAWLGGSLEGAFARVYAMLLLVVAAAVAYVGWLGGRMVYGHGIGVL